MPKDVRSVVAAAYRAYETKDRAAIEDVIADDFHFTSPLDNRIDRATYFDICWPASENIDRFEFVSFVVDGERAFVTYNGSGKRMPTFRNTEIYRVLDGKIVDVQVYFGWSIPHEVAAGTHRDPS